jgi:hypothetical protein
MAERALPRRMTLLDNPTVLTPLVGGAASFFGLGGGAQGERVVVERGGRILFTAPLDEDRTVSLPGSLGETVLSVHDGRACIVSSPCPLKICMGMGEVSRAGELLACVPNELLVRIEGGQEERSHDLISH